MTDRDTCLCGGTFVEVVAAGSWGVTVWTACDRCGGALTASGEFLPAGSGWNIPRVPKTQPHEEGR